MFERTKNLADDEEEEEGGQEEVEGHEEVTRLGVMIWLGVTTPHKQGVTTPHKQGVTTPHKQV